MGKAGEGALKEALGRRLLVLDGAMGTAIQALGLTAADFGGPQYEGCNEHLVLTQPEVIAGIHRSYLEAGCDIIQTNTFGATRMVLDEYGLGAKAAEINRAAACLARGAADAAATPDKPRFVAGDMGPTTKAMSVTGGVAFAELLEHFYEQAKALWEGGVDYLLFETCQDTRNVKAGLLAAERLASELGEDVAVAVSATIEGTGTMLAGQTVEALYASVSHFDLVYLGLNCATGPEFMTDHVRTLAEISHFPVACVPNAGLPDEDGTYLETPEMVARVLDRFLHDGWLNLIGGCCGTCPGHIAELAGLAAKYPPRVPVQRAASMVSGVNYLEVADDLRPLIVGERTNVIGSRKFKRLIVDEKFEEAAEVARAQVKNGAQIIDVCLANPDRDELADVEKFLGQAIKQVRAPIMIDSTDEKVIERALTYCQGKSLINSINLEDGLDRFEKVVPLARRYGAALVVGTIDDDPEQGMGVTRQRKLAIAERAHRILTEDFGVSSEDIYWDPLVFPCATGDENYAGSAVETIEGIRLIKERFPASKTILGISNVSFGLPPAGREVLNSVFLYHCVQAGLDLAIVNSEKLERFGSIPPDEVRLAEDLLWNRGKDPIGEFAAKYRGRKAKPAIDKSLIPLDERLSSYIVEGSKDGLIEDLDEKLAEAKPLDIINGPLMAGMDEVGRLFNDNKLIVAEVLQSAEAMKAAVAHLETFMEKGDSASRGKVLLATVKGDVHDIGKNLVDIILGNNGFDVVNLGIKVPPERLIAATREHQPDIIGLSGLLVKSAQMMLVTAEDFSRADIAVPMLVGGAALSEKFVMTRIDPAYAGSAVYAKDAMRGLDLAKSIVDPDQFAELQTQLAERRERLFGDQAPAAAAEESVGPSTIRSSALPPVEAPPSPPDYRRHILRGVPPDQVWGWINPRMLFGRHLGLKGTAMKLAGQAMTDANAKRELADNDPGTFKILEAVDQVKDEVRDTDVLCPTAVYQFFRCASEGNTLHVYPQDGSGEPGCSLVFPRQDRDDGLCLADLANPVGGAPDNLCMFVTTAGQGVRQKSEELKARGELLKSHIVLALAIESAEAYAELLHAQIRRMWGVQDRPDLSMQQMFQAKYEGKRYSFGYPACPNLEDQRALWRLLRPEDIDCQLTDELMMDPEASVSAVAFHHPAAEYFNVGAAIVRA